MRALKKTISLVIVLNLNLALIRHQAFAQNCILPTLQQAMDNSQELVKYSPTKYDTAVEVEYEFTYEADSYNLLHLVTTTDGKLGSLLKEKESFPKDIVRYLSIHYPEQKVLKEIPWDDLNLMEQRMVLRSISASRNLNFFKNRKIHGLRIREEMTWDFPKDMTLFGKLYKKGINKINLLDFIENQIEFKNQFAPKTMSGFELHFRKNIKPSQLSHDVQRFTKLLRLPPKGQHIHIVSEFPKELLNTRNEASFLMADLHRRENTVLEMMNVLFDGFPIQDSKHTSFLQSYFHFGTLKSDQVYFLAKNLSKANEKEFGAQNLKISYLGIHGPGKYDNPNLYGKQLRSIDAECDYTLYAPIIDQIQENIVNNDFHYNAQQMQNWKNHIFKNESSMQAAFDVYSKQAAATTLFGGRKNQHGILFSYQEKIKIDRLMKSNKELKMLFLNWRIFFNTDTQKRIISTQKKYLSEFKSSLSSKNTSPEEINSLINRFVKESGLLEILENESDALTTFRAHYNQSAEILFEDAESQHQIHFGFRDQTKISTWMKSSQELKMLFFDWQKDNVYFFNPDAQSRIIATQKKYLSLFKEGLDSKGMNSEEINSLVSRFIKESGLFELYLQSIGLDQKDITKLLK